MTVKAMLHWFPTVSGKLGLFAYFGAKVAPLSILCSKGARHTDKLDYGKKRLVISFRLYLQEFIYFIFKCKPNSP